MSKPERVKGMSFAEMMSDVMTEKSKAIKYVRETGLCFCCKKNPVVENQLECQECIDEREKLVSQLRGTPGFMEFKV